MRNGTKGLVTGARVREKRQGSHSLNLCSLSVSRCVRLSQNQLSVLSTSVLIKELNIESFTFAHLEGGSPSFGLLICKMESIEPTLLGCCEGEPRVVVMGTVHLWGPDTHQALRSALLHAPFQLILTIAGEVPTAVPMFLLRKL